MELETARELAQEKVNYLKRVDSLADHLESDPEISCSELFASLGQRIEVLPGFSQPMDAKGNVSVLFPAQSLDEPPFLKLNLQTEHVYVNSSVKRLHRIAARWHMLESENAGYTDAGAQDELILEDVFFNQTEIDNDSTRQRLNLIAQSVGEAELAFAKT